MIAAVHSGEKAVRRAEGNMDARTEYFRAAEKKQQLVPVRAPVMSSRPGGVTPNKVHRLQHFKGIAFRLPCMCYNCYSLQRKSSTPVKSAPSREALLQHRGAVAVIDDFVVALDPPAAPVFPPGSGARPKQKVSFPR